MTPSRISKGAYTAAMFVLFGAAPFTGRSEAATVIPLAVHLFCRGPIDTGFNGDAQIFLPRFSEKAAGPRGQDLNPGECAWGDRALRDDERAKPLVYQWKQDQTERTVDKVRRMVVSQCLMDEKCVYRSLVTSSRVPDSGFLTDTWIFAPGRAVGRLFFPFSQAPQKNASP